MAVGHCLSPTPWKAPWCTVTFSYHFSSWTCLGRIPARNKPVRYRNACKRTTTWSPSVKLCFRRCGNAVPGTPRADPSVVQGLREKKGREKRLSWLQKEFPHHLSNTMQLQQVLEHGLTWRARVCFFKPSLDFQKSQIAPRTHRLAHQKSLTQYQQMACLTNFIFCMNTSSMLPLHHTCEMSTWCF